MPDTLWSDVSEWQVPVDDSYPYQVLAIRSNDGTYRDNHFSENYQWACRALDSGRLAILIIYLVYRPNWQDDLATLKSVVGTPHPGTVFMLDVESWGAQIGGDNSDAINRLYWGVCDWLGTSEQSGTRRVLGYGNANDINTLWPTRPAGLGLVIAAYGANPDYPGKIAHQFTDGVYGGPIWVPPFGDADVNSADGLDITALQAAFGLTTEEETMADELIADIREQLCGQGSRQGGEYTGWPQLGTNAAGANRTVVDALAAAMADIAATKATVAAIAGKLGVDVVPPTAPPSGAAQ